MHEMEEPTTGLGWHGLRERRKRLGGVGLGGKGGG